jgi:nucleoside 2-deoxyribosyltransferase
VENKAMTIETGKVCPICKLEDQTVNTSDFGEKLSLECPRCGRFKITRTAATMAKRREITPKLSAWIRDRTESDVSVPEINSETLKEIENVFPTYRVSEKQLLLLRAFERRTNFPGQGLLMVSEIDYPLAWAAGEDEFCYLLRSLIERGLVRRTDGPATLDDSFVYTFEITPDGWTYLDSHERSSIISDQVFVAMSFSPELKPAWICAIDPAIRKVGFRPYRVDTEPHIGKIDTKIMAEIKNSRFLVADVTQQRPGVYFEAGYALGLGLPVFWCVKKDDLNNVHFDTRQYNHIVWENEENLAEQLELFMIAIIGKGSAS